MTHALLQDACPLPVRSLLLVDVQEPALPASRDPRVSVRAVDLSAEGAAARLLEGRVDVLFHLAAVVSGHAEADFDIGMRVNFDATRALAEEARRRNPALRLVFSSTVGVFGGELPAVVDDLTAVTPQNSYGAEKAMCELLLCEYSRRGFVDARAVRLPTVTVRAGAANKAVTSFASGIVREPLSGLPCVCPVSASLRLWVASPGAVVSNLLHAAALPVRAGGWRVVNLPGICVSVGEMLNALREVAGEEVASLVRFERDEFIENMVSSFPSKFDNSRALELGFTVDKGFADIIRTYIRDDLGQQI